MYYENIDLCFEELIELYEAFHKYNYDFGKNCLSGEFNKKNVNGSNINSFIKLLELAANIDDQCMLNMCAKKLFIDHGVTSEMQTIPPKLFDRAICCLNLDIFLQQQPLKLLSLVERYISLNKESNVFGLERNFDQTFELFCWENANYSKILTSSVLNDDQKVKFLISSIKGNPPQNISSPFNRKAENQSEVFKYSFSYMTANAASPFGSPLVPLIKPLIPKVKNPVSLVYPDQLIKNLVSNLGESYVQQTHTDCEFLFSNKKILKAHKFILSLVSPVFSAMFYGDLNEGDSVEIVDAEEPVFNLFLKYDIVKSDI